MAGNHDTPSIWTVAKGWRDTGKLDAWVRMLTTQLGVQASALAENHSLLVHAVFASMFASAAENVSVFFTDLFGMDHAYNTPGTVNDDNWSLRLGPDFERDYAARIAGGDALNLPRALVMAFAARGNDFLHAHADLVAKLEQCAAAVCQPMH
jgi:hypothetical protein